MNNAKILQFINETLGTAYKSLFDVPPVDIARVDLAMQIDARLTQPPDQFEQWQLDRLPVEPRIVCKFSELVNRDLFSLPNYLPEFEPLYKKDTTLVIDPERHIVCSHCDGHENAVSQKCRNWHKRHFCSDDLVIPAKTMPSQQDGLEQFWLLEAGDTFLIIGDEGCTHEKTQRGAQVFCANCAPDQAYHNAHDGQKSIHVCPGTSVTEVPF